MARPRTIICDIDGVLIKHHGDITTQHLRKPEFLPGALLKLKQRDLEGCCIILVTGRRESTRYRTQRQLSDAGIIHDHLIMGVTGGVRELINDRKPDGSTTAVAYNLERNKGFRDERADNQIC